MLCITAIVSPKSNLLCLLATQYLLDAIKHKIKRNVFSIAAITKEFKHSAIQPKCINFLLYIHINIQGYSAVGWKTCRKGMGAKRQCWITQHCQVENAIYCKQQHFSVMAKLQVLNQREVHILRQEVYMLQRKVYMLRNALEILTTSQ